MPEMSCACRPITSDLHSRGEPSRAGEAALVHREKTPHRIFARGVLNSKLDFQRSEAGIVSHQGNPSDAQSPFNDDRCAMECLFCALSNCREATRTDYRIRQHRRRNSGSALSAPGAAGHHPSGLEAATWRSMTAGIQLTRRRASLDSSVSPSKSCMAGVSENRARSFRQLTLRTARGDCSWTSDTAAINTPNRLHSRKSQMRVPNR